MFKRHAKDVLKLLGMLLLLVLMLIWIGYYFSTCQPFSMRPIGELPSICLYLSRR